MAVIEVKSTKTIAITREEPIAIWNPQTLQSESTTRVVHERLLIAKFKALRIYKGLESATRVETRAEADECGVALAPGSRYLVYAYGSEDNNRISTGRCMRTALTDESTQDIEILDAMTKPVSVVFRLSGPELRFNEALDLIHSYSVEGEGEELSQAMAIADELSRSDPLSGYSQTLQAEILSIWQLDDYGLPMELQQEVLSLTDEALRINPKLAQAHVARARTYARAAKPTEAEVEIQTALRIQPQLDSAIFVQAEIYRRLNDSAKAESWMRNFIAVTKQPVHKANGYQWLGNMRRDIAYHPQALNRQVDLLMAKSSYQMSISLDPNNAWRLANFAAFLNEYPADFAAAENYATKALAVQESPLARHHLAAARYQALQAKGAEIDAQTLRESIAEIEASTGVSLDQAVEFEAFREVITVRLLRLQRRARSPVP